MYCKIHMLNKKRQLEIQTTVAQWLEHWRGTILHGKSRTKFPISDKGLKSGKASG